MGFPPIGRAPDSGLFDCSTIELEMSISNQFDLYFHEHSDTGENLRNETGAL